MIATNTPVAPSTMYHAPCKGRSPPRETATAARVRAATQVRTAAPRLSPSAWRGVRASSTSRAPAMGRAGTSQASVGTSSVTQTPQQLGVPRAELAVDPLREHGGDGDDQGEVEERAQLDDVRQTAGDRHGEEREAVLGNDHTQELEQ